MTELEASGVGEPPPSYMIFLVVFLFFLTGLLGFLVCHLLKKKGYRCRTGDMEDEEEEEKLGGNEDEEHEGNQDTVEQILKCILENEANMEAFNEMLGNNVCVRHDPRLRKESIGGLPPHLHTVHSGTDHNTCHLCAQVRAKKGRRHSRTPRFKQRPGEQTVFSVGRFRVIHTDKKLHGGANPLAASGDQLDRSQDSEDRKDAGYNLRSMFKDARSPSDGANGLSASVGKRKKSVTIFGVRRGSDPSGIRVKEGMGRESGEVKFIFKQPPVVLEEPLQAEHVEAGPGHFTKPDTKPEHKPASAQRGAKGSSSVHSASIQSKTQACSEAAHVSPPNSSERGLNLDSKVLKTEEAFVPGPLQTSTPIIPMPTSLPGFVPIAQPEQPSSKGFSVDQTPPDPCSSPYLEPGFGAGLPLISLGSSPLASLGGTPSSNSTSGHLLSEAVKTSLSPGPTPSPKLLPGPERSEQEPNSSSPLEKSGSPVQLHSPSATRSAGTILNLTSSPPPAGPNLSFTDSLPPRLTVLSVASPKPVNKEGVVPSSLTIKEREKEEGTTIQKTVEKMEKKRAGILKTTKCSPVAAGDPGFSSPSDVFFKDKLSSLPSSPFSPLSPSSPEGSRICSVTIVKASPDSKREFSVVTMLEEEETSTSIREQRCEVSQRKERGDISPADVSLSGAEEPQSGVEVRSLLNQEKEDLMEMEDIRDCKVTQVEGAKRLDEDDVMQRDQQVKSEDDEQLKMSYDDPEKGKHGTTK